MQRIFLFFKRNYIYLFIFCYFFLCLQFVYSSYKLDTFANYGFSYAITKGEVPYNDFNLIVPLFGPFIYSIGMFINHSLVIMYLEQALLLTILSFIIFKLLGKTKGWILLIILMLPFPIPFVYCIYPGYNFLILFFFFLLVYLEKFNKSDKIIGIVLGLCILTKQSIGILFLLPTIFYYYNNLKKVLTRYLYALIPIGLFISYLVITKSFFNFINLCFLGMFDFSKNNSNYMMRYLILIIFCILLIFIKLIKNKNIIYLYLLMAVSFVYPILDFYHCSLFLILFIFVLLLYSKDIYIKYISIISIAILSFISCSWLIINFKVVGNLSIYSFHNFYYQILSKNYKLGIDRVNRYMNNKDVIYLLSEEYSMLFTISNEKSLSYYSLLNRGNHGFNGSKMMFDKLKREKNKYFVIEYNNRSLYDYNQFMFELTDYIRKNTKLVKRIDNFYIYYKE